MLQLKFTSYKSIAIIECGGNTSDHSADVCDEEFSQGTELRPCFLPFCAFVFKYTVTWVNRAVQTGSNQFAPAGTTLRYRRSIFFIDWLFFWKKFFFFQLLLSFLGLVYTGGNIPQIRYKLDVPLTFCSEFGKCLLSYRKWERSLRGRQSCYVASYAAVLSDAPQPTERH